MQNDTQQFPFRDNYTDEPEWSYNLRKTAWENYFRMPVPSRVDHIWKYSDPADYLPEYTADLFSGLPLVAPNGHSLKPEDQAEWAGAMGATLDQFYSVTTLPAELRKKGVIFMGLSQALRQHPELVQGKLGGLIASDFGKIENLNQAFWNTGFFLYVPDNVVIERPVHIQRNFEAPVSMTRLLVITGSNSQLTLVDDLTAPDGNPAGQVNSVNEIFAGENSSLDYVFLQRLQKNQKLYYTHRGEVARDGRMRSHFLSLGANTGKANIGVTLAGEGADSRLQGLLFGHDTQRFDHHTRHRHTAGNTYSKLDMKVAVRDKANSAYTGLIEIEEDAKNCEAYQENRNLILSETAKAESIPELEIKNNEVSCSHGVTMGSIDPEMLFYMQSRGLFSEEAIQMYVHGFYASIIDELPEAIRELARDLLDEQIGSKSVAA